MNKYYFATHRSQEDHPAQERTKQFVYIVWSAFVKILNQQILFAFLPVLGKPLF